MSLENTIHVLEKAMKNELEKVDSKLLEKRDVQDTLTTFFAEQQTRPELVRQIRSQSLMYEYLQFSLERREEIEVFRRKYPAYFARKERVVKGNSFEAGVKSVHSRQWIRKTRHTHQILQIFDFYLKTRKENDVFNVVYLLKGGALKVEFGNLAKNIYLNVIRNVHEEGDVQKLFMLAAELNPEIKKYTTFKEVLKIDGPKQLIRMFEFYLTHRKRLDVFNADYIQRDIDLKRIYGSLGRNLYENARRHLKDEGGVQYIVQLVAQERPEILEYWSYDRHKRKK